MPFLSAFLVIIKQFLFLLQHPNYIGIMKYYCSGDGDGILSWIVISYLVLKKQYNIQTQKQLKRSSIQCYAVFKCIFKDLLTNLNVRFGFFSKRDSWKPPTYQTKKSNGLLLQLKKIMFSILGTLTVVKFKIIL
jgi:hypothetical protein